jgi:hypothetical protein
MNTVNPAESPEAANEEGGAKPALPDRKNTVAALKDAILHKLTYSVGKDPIAATDRDWFFAVALAVRDRVTNKWMESTRAAYAYNRKRVYYLSLEFLIGRLLFDALNNLGLTEAVRSAVRELGADLDQFAISNQMRRSVMAASVVWPPVTWRAWRRSESRRTAMASATITGCSARKSRTDGNSNIPRTGSNSGIPGNSADRKSTTRSASAAR